MNGALWTEREIRLKAIVTALYLLLSVVALGAAGVLHAIDGGASNTAGGARDCGSPWIQTLIAVGITLLVVTAQSATSYAAAKRQKYS